MMLAGLHDEEGGIYYVKYRYIFKIFYQSIYSNLFLAISSEIIICENTSVPKVTTNFNNQRKYYGTYYLNPKQRTNEKYFYGFEMRICCLQSKHLIHAYK